MFLLYLFLNYIKLNEYHYCLFLKLIIKNCLLFFLLGVGGHIKINPLIKG